MKFRVFIAITLPRHIVATLGDVQADLKQFGLKVKWTRPEKIHLTLKFLGDVNEKDIQTVVTIVDRSTTGIEAIRLRARGVGVFPSVKRARVLWTGITGQTDLLGKLQENIDAGLSEIGFLREKRRFTGHLTVGRLKGTHHPDKLIDIIKKFKDMESDLFTADTVHVIKSDLTPSGPIYTKLASVQFVKKE